jgi:hypothetical protein
MLKLCTIHLDFDRGCFEVVLIKITHRTLGVNQMDFSWTKEGLDYYKH